MDFTNPNRIEPFFDVEAETNVRVTGPDLSRDGRRRGARPSSCGRRSTPDPPLPTSDVLASAVHRRAPPAWPPTRRAARADRTPTQAQTDILTARATAGGRGAAVVRGRQRSSSRPSASTRFSSRRRSSIPTASRRSVNPTARLTIGKRISRPPCHRRSRAASARRSTIGSTLLGLHEQRAA